ncbi:MAG TPA: GspMb/PilO family protein, partial [Stellaceae bacterium]
FRKIAVQFSVEGTLDTLQKTLAAVETKTPALFVDGFTVAAAENGAGRDHPPMLDFDLNVAGYMPAAGS